MVTKTENLSGSSFDVLQFDGRYTRTTNALPTTNPLSATNVGVRLHDVVLSKIKSEGS